MNKYIQTTYGSCQRALAFTKQHDSQWAEGDTIRSVIDRLKGATSTLAELSSQQLTFEQQQIQATADQTEFLEAMQSNLKATIRMTRKLGEAEIAFALQTRLDQVRRQSDWLDLAEAVITNLEGQVEVMVANGAKAGFLEELQQQLDGVLEAHGRQTEAQVSRMGVTRRLKDQEIECRRLLGLVNEALAMRLRKQPILLRQWAAVKRRRDLYLTPLKLEEGSPEVEPSMEPNEPNEPAAGTGEAAAG